MNFLSRQPYYPGAIKNIGRPIEGKINGKQWWLAKGSVKRDYENAVGKISEQMNLSFRKTYSRDLTFDLYMIGDSIEQPESARPTVVFFCEDRKARKAAKKAFEGTQSFKDNLPDFQTDHHTEMPDMGPLEQPADIRRVDRTPPDLTVVEATGQVYFDPHKPICNFGMAIYALDEAGHTRQATANTVYAGERLMLLTVSHVFKIRGLNPVEYFVQGQSTLNPSDKFKGRDEGGDLMETPSNTGTDSEEDLPKQEPGPSIGDTMLLDENSPKGGSPGVPIPIPPNLHVLGSVIRFSIDQDWALIEITDESVSSTLGQPTNAGPVSPITVDNTLSMEDLSQIPSVEIRTSSKPVSGRLMVQSPYMRLPGSGSFVRVVQFALEEALDRGDCGSGAFDAVSGDIFGHVVATSQRRDVAFVIPASLVCELANVLWASSTQLGHDKRTPEWDEPEEEGRSHPSGSTVLIGMQGLERSLPRRESYSSIEGTGGSTYNIHGGIRQSGPCYQIGDEVQMDVVETDRDGRKILFAKRFFVHNKGFAADKKQWMYQLNEEVDGRPGAPWRGHSWVAERPLAPVL